MSFLRQHKILFFFVLAYVLAWGAIPWNSFFAPGALIAAVVVVFVTEGLPGLRRVGARLIRWRVSWIWYALALAVPLAAHAIAVATNVVLGAPAPSLSLLTPWYGLPLALGMHVINPTGGPLMEEPSFRGFAQPDLQRGHSPLVATAIMAVAVAGWHAPLFFRPVFQTPPVGFLTTVAVTFWYAWLLNRSGISSLITLIAHGVEGGVETNGFWSTGADADRLNWTYALAWCVIVLVLLVADRRFWVRPPKIDDSAATAGPARSPDDVAGRT